MSCRKQRLEANGAGCSEAKAIKADEVEDENDAEEEEEEWKQDDEEETDGGSRTSYNIWGSDDLLDIHGGSGRSRDEMAALSTGHIFAGDTRTLRNGEKAKYSVRAESKPGLKLSNSAFKATVSVTAVIIVLTLRGILAFAMIALETDICHR